MTIEEILGYLQIDPDVKDTVLYGMLEELQETAWQRGFSVAQAEF